MQYIYKQLLRLTIHKYLLSGIWTLIIVYLSLGRMPNPEPVTKLIPFLDKIAHFSMYFILSTLLLLEFLKSAKKNIIVLIMFYSICMGALMEILQAYLFIYRSGDYYDILFNSIGSLTALALYFYYKKTIER